LLLTSFLNLGIDREYRTGQRLLLQDHGRYADIMSSTRQSRSVESQTTRLGETFDTSRDHRTPSLVSFVGQTAAGKSTLVKLLISYKTQKGGPKMPSPVVGMIGKDVPTSEGVHLYSDPQTVYSESPILYADCEGLEGGERLPVAASFRAHRQSYHVDHSLSSETHHDFGEFSRAKYGPDREIMWSDSPSRQTRQFAVSNLYPRLLYTFSDTIVFVLRNPRYDSSRILYFQRS
jgi:energy-coupling factor transporter ATP-binding protein EcfA2